MFVKVRRRHHANQTYEYLDIVESHRVGKRVVQRKLGCLGRLDQLDRKQIDRLIEYLRRFASPQGLGGVPLGAVEIQVVREYGIPLVVGQLWSELQLDRLLAALPQKKKPPIRDELFQESVFRMVVNRLCEPHSKLGLVDWTDEHGAVHRGWQREVQWSRQEVLDYHHYLLSMDRLHPHQEKLEEALFDRTTDLLSLPLRLCFYDLTSVYFEGEGRSELAEYGYSRDHRDDRAQIVVGLAVTQEGLPITHRVYKGATADVTTFAPMAEELKRRFGLQEPVIVADRGMFSQDNVEKLQGSGLRYILAVRARQQLEGLVAVGMALRAGLPRPTAISSPWQVREVEAMPGSGYRHIVVYSAFKARHDFEVRAKRIRKALAALRNLQAQASSGKLDRDRVMERATRILIENKCRRYVGFTVGENGLFYAIDRHEYRDQRHQDGIFVLETNHPELATDDVVASYRQLIEVERAFRVLKSLLKMRPIYHHRDRRVEAHVFICFLAYLIAKLIEQRLRRAGLSHSIAHALDILSRLKAVEHTWEKEAVVIKATKPDDEVKTVLNALNIGAGSPILSVTRTAAA